MSVVEQCKSPCKLDFKESFRTNERPWAEFQVQVQVQVCLHIWTEGGIVSTEWFMRVNKLGFGVTFHGYLGKLVPASWDSFPDSHGNPLGGLSLRREICSHQRCFQLLLFPLGILSTPPSLVVVKAASCGLQLPSRPVRFIVLPYREELSQN